MHLSVSLLKFLYYILGPTFHSMKLYIPAPKFFVMQFQQKVSNPFKTAAAVAFCDHKIAHVNAT
jgi:hypothetical protein